MGSLTDNTGPTSVPAKACQEEISKQRLTTKAQESAVHFFGQTHERRRGSGQRFIPLIHLSSSMKAGAAAAFTVVNPYVTGMAIVDNPEDQLDTSNAAEVVQGRSHGHFIGRMSEEEQLAAAGLQWPPRSYSCTFCRREFCTAQALGGHMNVHRRQRALLRAAASDQQYSNSLSPASCTTSPTPSPAPINIFFNKGLNISNPETNSSLTHPAAVLIGAGCSCSVHPGAAKTNSGLSMQEINETLSNSFAVPSTSLGLAPYCPVISDHQRSCDNNGRPQLKRVKLQNNISTADSDHNKLFVCNEGVINNSKHLPSLDLELRLGEPIIHSWHSSTTTTTTLIK